VKHTELRVEVRHDMANQDLYRAGAAANQTTAQIAALAWF
jgi:hypothetical protein